MRRSLLRSVARAASLGGLLTALSCGGSDVGTGPGGDPVPTTITLSETEVAFSSLGTTARLVATVMDQSGAVMSGATMTWTSSDETVAAVSVGGEVTARGNGSASVAVSAGNATARATVTVAQLPDTIVVTPDRVVLNGAADTLTAVARVHDAGGSEVPGETVTWSSADPSIVSVSDGFLTAVSEGSAWIAATSGSLSTVVPVTVTRAPASITLTPTSVELESLGATATVTAVVRDASGAVIQGAEVRWATGDPAVVTVDGGSITAVGVGTAAVAATAGTVSEQLTATVVQTPSYVSISPDPIGLNGPGDTVRAVATVHDAGGSPIPGAGLSWSSANTAVATVSPDGVVRAEGEGTTTVTATSAPLSATVDVTVTRTPASITLSPDSVTLEAVGDTVRITAVVRDTNGDVITGAAVAWSSSDPGIASVDGGLVTAAALGTATVTASAGDLSASAAVVVQAPIQAPSFSQAVNEIFVRTGCTSGNCHGGNAGNLTLTSSSATSYANLVNVPSSAEPSWLRVAPNDSFNSYLVMKLEGRQSSGARMPIGGRALSATDLATIKSWIDAGAPNN